MVVLRNNVFGWAVFAGLSLSATGAIAGGTPSGPPSSYDRPGIWTGLYGGVTLGNADVDHGDNGLVGGVGLGYNWRSNQFVYGVEGDISVSNSDSIDWLGSLRGRLGYLIQPNLLLYGTAGLGFVSAEDTNTGFVWGLGVEAKFTPSMSGKVEYLSFNNDSGHGHNDDVNVIRAGLNFKLPAW